MTNYFAETIFGRTLQGEDRDPGSLQRDRIQADVPLPQRALPSHCGHSEG